MTGSASVETVPDIVLASLGVDVRSTDISTALRTAEESLARMRDSLLEGGVDRAGLRTSRSTIWREVVTDGAGTNTTVTHVRLGLQVRMREVATAGDLVHAALAAGGVDATMDSMDFAVSDTREALVQARDAAFDEARRIAEAYAARAGRALGEVTSITEGAVGTAPGPMPKVAFAAPAGSMPVEPGQTSVDASVTVTWELAPRI
ncbi:SIMPL domain-containing protein [Pseudactinotalea sp.]|uniref:SIMPL domain-containing protein n=1 Tax=Pseudactinotalea sp. TaxID=1926260 RepID=UPI003B3A9C16